MNSVITKRAVILGIITSLTFVSYFAFERYEPKSIRKVAEVRGYSSQSDLPSPLYSENIGSTQSQDTQQITFATKKTIQELETFYRIYFLERDWELESKGNDEHGLVIKYKKEDKLATIIAQKENDQYLVSVEISKRK